MLLFQVRWQCQGGPFPGEDQAVELHIRPQNQTDFRERARGHLTPHLPAGLVDPVLQHSGAHAAGAARRPALPLRLCGGEGAHSSAVGPFFKQSQDLVSVVDFTLSRHLFMVLSPGSWC